MIAGLNAGGWPRRDDHDEDRAHEQQLDDAEGNRHQVCRLARAHPNGGGRRRRARGPPGRADGRHHDVVDADDAADGGRARGDRRRACGRDRAEPRDLRAVRRAGRPDPAHRQLAEHALRGLPNGRAADFGSALAPPAPWRPRRQARERDRRRGPAGAHERGRRAGGSDRAVAAKARRRRVDRPGAERDRRRRLEPPDPRRVRRARATRCCIKCGQPGELRNGTGKNYSGGWLRPECALCWQASGRK